MTSTPFKGRRLVFTSQSPGGLEEKEENSLRGWNQLTPPKKEKRSHNNGYVSSDDEGDGWLKAPCPPICVIQPPLYMTIELESPRMFELRLAKHHDNFHELQYAVLRSTQVEQESITTMSTVVDHESATKHKRQKVITFKFRRTFLVRYVPTESLRRANESLRSHLPDKKEKERSIKDKEKEESITDNFVYMNKTTISPPEVKWSVEFYGGREQMVSVYWLFRCRRFFLSSLIQTELKNNTETLSPPAAADSTDSDSSSSSPVVSSPASSSSSSSQTSTPEKLEIQKTKQNKIVFRYQAVFEFDDHADMKKDNRSCSF